MKLFQCDNCGHPVFFENTHCENCSLALGFSSDDVSLYALQADNGLWTTLGTTPRSYRYCSNHQHGICNWLIDANLPNTLCQACAFNETIPDLSQPQNLQYWKDIEVAKHRLIYNLLQLNLPLQTKADSPETGLEFHFLSEQLASDGENVMTGHANGVITIALSEADSAYREKMRLQMGEHYRTLIGHFRHEIGHYYWDVLIQNNPELLHAFRQTFGDERINYSKALEEHYAKPDDGGWRVNYVSHYAASHPWEDWAESWAHYFHLVDVLETAFSFGLKAAPQVTQNQSLNLDASFDPYKSDDFDAIISNSIPLSFAVNSINRSMGLPDLYPFVLPEKVVEKLTFIHQTIKSCA